MSHVDSPSVTDLLRLMQSRNQRITIRFTRGKGDILLEVRTRTSQHHALKKVIPGEALRVLRDIDGYVQREIEKLSDQLFEKVG